MSIELWSLLTTTVIFYLAIFIQQIAKDRIYGVKYALSNRERVPTESPSPTIERLTRLVNNHSEGMIIFATLILIASVTGISNGFTQYAAMTIAVMRGLHFIFYAFAITPFRSFAWGIGFIAAIPVFVYGLLSG